MHAYFEEDVIEGTRVSCICIYACPSGKHGCYLMFIFAIAVLPSTFHIIAGLHYHIQTQSEDGHKK